MKNASVPVETEKRIRLNYEKCRYARRKWRKNTVESEKSVDTPVETEKKIRLNHEKCRYARRNWEKSTVRS